ncbi:MAG: hypothetical protein IKE56_03560 [Lachnospiraceae bacterium]|nr:hypothetical protein [Lachnospiraceae bacterium]MBQ9402635.1 hypothetical protein [Clostridia bacterium]MBR2531729.1 hypothetical protein [Lachnospiraceae bacterium]
MMQLQLKKESDLYSPYDPSGRMIHTQVYDYLKTFCTEAESKKHIHDTLQIVSEEPIDAVRAKQAIRDAVQRDIAQFDAQIERNRKMALRDLITGVLLTILGITLYVILNQFLLAIISFLGTMAISSAMTILIKLNPDIRRLRSLLDPFTDFEVEVIQK